MYDTDSQKYPTFQNTFEKAMDNTDLKEVEAVVANELNRGSQDYNEHEMTAVKAASVLLQHETSSLLEKINN